MNLGNALVILYLLYYLQDAVDLTDDEAEDGVLPADRGCTAVLHRAHRGRRRHLVRPAGPAQGLRDRLRARAPPPPCSCWRSCTTWAGAFVGAVILGVGFGIYTAVDFAMITQVLPDAPTDRAKDLGVINIANALPQVLAPGVAADRARPRRSATPTLYVLAALAAVLGSFLVRRIVGVP